MQTRVDCRRVGRRCDNKRRFTLLHTRPDELADDATQRVRVLIELHGVKVSDLV